MRRSHSGEPDERSSEGIHSAAADDNLRYRAHLPESPRRLLHRASPPLPSHAHCPRPRGVDAVVPLRVGPECLRRGPARRRPTRHGRDRGRRGVLLHERMLRRRSRRGSLRSDREALRHLPVGVLRAEVPCRPRTARCALRWRRAAAADRSAVSVLRRSDDIRREPCRRLAMAAGAPTGSLLGRAERAASLFRPSDLMP